MSPETARMPSYIPAEDSPPGSIQSSQLVHFVQAKTFRLGLKNSGEFLRRIRPYIKAETECCTPQSRVKLFQKNMVSLIII